MVGAGLDRPFYLCLCGRVHLLKDILQKVQKPSQYLGNEVNSIHKDFDECSLRVCLVFPDAYELGMSHMGLKILYDILNNIEGIVAERCFAPLPDMEAELREHNLPLTSLESKTPLSEFDIIGISLPYELVYTNALNIIDLAGIPLFQKDRKDHHPLILSGGTQSYNPEPMADFLDCIAIGDSEELIVDVVKTVLFWKERFKINKISENKNTGSREKLLSSLTEIEGMYIPKFFEPTYKDNGQIAEVKSLKEGYTGVKKRIVKDLNIQPYPTKIIVPSIKLIHDRIGIEIQRGCTRMCRFCQAGYIERPTRQRSPEKVLDIADKSYNDTGIDEISLLSLSAGDYGTIVPTLKELNKRYKKKNVSIAVPATRTETLTPEMIEQIKQVRMSGFTIAPEAGSERMRRVINKGNKVEDLMQASRNAFSAGYRLIKFYYMCGLPFETDDDVKNIAEESYKSWQIGREYSRKVTINVSVSSFVPKPFTPFQWEPQMSIEETKRKHHLVRSNLKVRSLQFKHHDPRMSYLEGLFARGDRRLSAVLHQAFKNGCRFDEWTEHFNFDQWEKAFEQTHVDLDFYMHRRREKEETLPWDHLFTQMDKDWLWKEYEAAKKEAYVADCSIEKCAAFCGVCDFKEVKNKVYVVDEKPLAAKKGNREWYGRFAGKELPETSEKTANLSEKQAQTITKFKLRARFSKVGYAALFGHLELMGIIKRAILRSGFRVHYSEGFHPQMKLAMGLALPLGYESEHEFFDLMLCDKVQPNDFIKNINKNLPLGLQILSAEFIDLRTPSLYSMTRSGDYRVTFPTKTDRWVEFVNNLEDFNDGKDFVFERVRSGKKKTRTIRVNNYLQKARVDEAHNKTICLTLACDDAGTIKPTEVISALTDSHNELAKLQVKKVGVELTKN